jgi:hypothetical protein
MNDFAQITQQPKFEKQWTHLINLEINFEEHFVS